MAEPLRRGRRRCGSIYTLPSGRQFCLVNRKLKDIDRAGEKTISDAVRAGTAAWGIDEEILIKMRAKGVRVIGVECRESKDIWLTLTDWFFDPEISRLGRRSQRLVPIGRFRKRSGRVRV